MASEPALGDAAGRLKAGAVREIFQRIAPRYDLMNRLMTGGQDRTWRARVIERAGLRPGDRLLDLGAGTGDLARQALRQTLGCRVLAADFTLEMMRRGQARPGAPLQWCAADALHLPLPDDAFDAVVSGFLLRNVADLPTALAEMRRVLKPGGRLVALDTTRPGGGLFAPLIRFHMYRVIPWLGGLVTGAHDAYTYLPESSGSFLAAEELQRCVEQAGFGRAGFERLMFGTVAIHWAERQER